MSPNIGSETVTNMVLCPVQDKGCVIPVDMVRSGKLILFGCTGAYNGIEKPWPTSISPVSDPH